MNEVDLVELGYKFRVHHMRFYSPIDNRTRVRDAHLPAQFVKGGHMKPYPRGGITEVTVYGPEGEFIATGVAFCSPKDNYCRKIGRSEAVDRALRVAFAKLTDTYNERRHGSATPTDSGSHR